MSARIGPDRVHIRGRARQSAREVIDENPRATLHEIASIAWLRGFTDAIAAAPDGPTIETCKTFYDNSSTCQRCGRKVRSGGSSPADLDRVFCVACSTFEEMPR